MRRQSPPLRTRYIEQRVAIVHGAYSYAPRSLGACSATSSRESFVLVEPPVTPGQSVPGCECSDGADDRSHHQCLYQACVAGRDVEDHVNAEYDEARESSEHDRPLYPPRWAALVVGAIERGCQLRPYDRGVGVSRAALRCTSTGRRVRASFSRACEMSAIATPSPSPSPAICAPSGSMIVLRPV